MHQASEKPILSSSQSLKSGGQTTTEKEGSESQRTTSTQSSSVAQLNNSQISSTNEPTNALHTMQPQTLYILPQAQQPKSTATPPVVCHNDASKRVSCKGNANIEKAMSNYLSINKLIGKDASTFNFQDMPSTTRSVFIQKVYNHKFSNNVNKHSKTVLKTLFKNMPKTYKRHRRQLLLPLPLPQQYPSDSLSSLAQTLGSQPLLQPQLPQAVLGTLPQQQPQVVQPLFGSPSTLTTSSLAQPGKFVGMKQISPVNL